ncbi:MAG: oligosaccharide flippase family protein [Verrucomicrobiota bacterium]
MSKGQIIAIGDTLRLFSTQKIIQEVRVLLKGAFFKNIFTVIFGTAVAQVISLALMPVVSRIFTPADFGAFGSFTAVLGVFGAGATLQYSQALMLPKEETEAAHLFVLSCLATLGLASLCLLFNLVSPGYMLGMMKTSGMTWLLWLLPLAVLVNGLNQALQAWCIRRKAFRKTSGSQIVRSLFATGSQVIMGLCGLGGGGLVGGSVLGDTAASFTLCGAMPQGDYRHFWACRHWSQLWQTARKFNDFPAYAAPQNVLNAASQGIPVLLLAQYFGAAVAGGYALSIRVLQAPMNLVLTALRQVLFQKFSEAHNHGQKLFPLFLKMTTGLAMLAVIPCFIGFVWSPKLFGSILGKDWGEAGIYARWMILWLGMGFCNVPAILLGRILRQQRSLLLFDIMLLIGNSRVGCWRLLPESD